MGLNVLKPCLLLSALLLLAIPFAYGTAPPDERYTPGTPYYFSDFDPGQRPWKPGQHLNIEEVFKNYQYYEIVFDLDGTGITVTRYLSGNRDSSEKYLVLPDKSLRKN